MYIDIVKTAVAGDFTGSKYNANYRVGYKDGDNPFVQSTYGPSVDQATQDLDRRRPRSEISTTGSPFDGPGVRPGRHRCSSPRARCPTTPQIEEINVVFVKGVVGDIPKS